MTEKFHDFDAAEYLDTPEEIAAYIADALQTGDASYIAHALGVAARAKGMTELARETGLARQQLYNSLSSDGNPTLKTLLAVTKAFGVDITAQPVNIDSAAA